MKTALFFLFNIILFNFCDGQSLLPVDSATGNISYYGIGHVDSVSASDLFQRCKSWFALAYGSAKDVIQNENEGLNTIQGKGLFETHVRNLGSLYPWGHINYSITVACKDGRYRFEITNFYHEADFSIGKIDNTYNASSMYNPKRYIDRIRQELNDNVLELISSLKNGMQKSIMAKKDW